MGGKLRNDNDKLSISFGGTAKISLNYPNYRGGFFLMEGVQWRLCQNAGQTVCYFWIHVEKQNMFYLQHVLLIMSCSSHP